MNLVKLSKEIKEILEEGIANVFVWKVKRSWNYKIFWYDDPANDIYSNEDLKEINKIKSIDKCYLELNGYNDFLAYTLSYIKERIIRQYETNKEQISGELPKLQRKLLKIIEENETKNKIEIIESLENDKIFILKGFYKASVNICKMKIKAVEVGTNLKENQDVTNYIYFINNCYIEAMLKLKEAN